MYYMFLDGTQIPIPPQKLTTTTKNKNKTVNVMNLGEINIIKPKGLKTLEFEILLPNDNYPFNQSVFKNVFRASYYVKKLEKLKKDGDKFQFIVVRMKENGEMLDNTNITVTLEDFRIKESTDYGVDYVASIKLKEWKDYGTKTVRVTNGANGEKVGYIEENARQEKAPPKTIISNGKPLWQQVKKATGKGVNILGIAKVNKIAIPTIVAIGEVINLE